MPQSDMILNWSNALKTTDKGARYVAAQTAINHLANGFNESEAFDLMVADNFDIDMSKEVLSQVYEKNGSGAVMAPPTRFAMVVPTSYKDVMPLIDEALTRLSPTQFVDTIFNKLIITSQRDRDGWRRLAQQATHDPVANEILHEDLRPWIEETMLNSVLAAEKEQGRVASVNDADLKYIVTTASGVSEVDLKNGICNCERFQTGKFAAFGLACEHMVRAADTISPFSRLTRAINNK